MWFIDGVFHPDESDLPPRDPGDPGDANPGSTRICLDRVMTRSLLTAEDKDTCEEALDALEEEDFHHLPVTCADGRLVGVVSDRDLLKKDGHTVGEVMTTRVLTASPETELQTAAQAMIEEKVHCLVAIDEWQAPIGLLTSYDILSYLVNHPRYELWYE